MVEKRSQPGSRRPQGRPDETHHTKARTLSDQARARLASGKAARPGDDSEEPRTAAVQGKDLRGKTHHD